MGVLKNDVGRPSNEIIKKRNIFKVTTLVLSVGIIGLTAYILNDKGIINVNNDKTNNEITTKSDQKIEELDINSQEVIDLYEPFAYYMHEAENEELYKKDKIVPTDLSVEYRNRLALAKYLQKNKTEKITINSNNFNFETESITSESFKKSYIELFGENVKYEAKDFNSWGIWTIDTIYDEEKGIYYFGDVAGDWSSDHYVTELYKAEKQENEIDLYSYVGVLYSNSNYTKSGLFKNIVDAKNFENAIYEGTATDMDSKFMKTPTLYNCYVGNLSEVKDKVSKYKLVFKKDNNDNYIFTSIKKIDE